MTQQLEHSWVKEIFTTDELQQYATFEANLRSKDKAEFEKSWANLIKKISHNLAQSPTSEIGVAIGKKCIDWLNSIYGKKYAHLRTKKFEKGFREGKGLEEVGLTPEIVSWMDKAIDAYCKDRIYGILNQIGTEVSDDTIFHLWKELLEDIYGENYSCKKEIYKMALSDEKVSKKAKEWLKTLHT